jgi:hypothetical protein
MQVKKICLAILAALGAARERLGRNLVPVPSMFGQAGAVANTKSTAITNNDATPPTLNKTFVQGGRVYSSVAVVEVAAADDDTSVYRLFRVWSGDRVDGIDIGNDAITGGTSYDLGVYDTAVNGGAVVSAALFASALDLSSAGALSERTYEATATNIDKIEKQLWELLALTSDPKKYYDIALTANTVGTGAGTIAARLRSVKGA